VFDSLFNILFDCTVVDTEIATFFRSFSEHAKIFRIQYPLFAESTIYGCV